jgi:demethylmenaquinone methyltransferase/2-methoxy-6-polyprenyl-1,4-benzoquinol methylase
MTLPPNPGLRRAFLLYFDRVLPWIGRVISKHTNAYTWLPESTRTFPPPAELARRMERAGFTDVEYRLKVGGVTAVHVGIKSVKGEG